MALVLVVALGALRTLLGRAAPPVATITVTAATGQDACLPCGTQSWAQLGNAIIGCTHLAGGRAVTVLSHRLDGHPPPLEPGWLPPEQPQSRFRGRVAFCPSGPGQAGVSVLVRNISDADFGTYSCHITRHTGPQALCIVELQPAGAVSPTEVPKAAGLNTLLVICVLTAAIITVVATGVVVWARRQRYGWEPKGAAELSSLNREKNEFLLQPETKHNQCNLQTEEQNQR